MDPRPVPKVHKMSWETFLQTGHSGKIGFLLGENTDSLLRGQICF